LKLRLYLVPLLRYTAPKNGDLKTDGRCHSRSLKMALFDKSYMTSAYILDAMHTCCTVKSEIMNITYGGKNEFL